MSCLVGSCGSDASREPTISKAPTPLLQEIIPVATAPKTLSLELEELLQAEPELPGDVSPPLENVVLDLSLSAEILATGDDSVGTLQLDTNRLPDLFEQTEKEPKTSFNVRLLRNEGLPNLSKNIDGLNLTIERRLGG